MRLGVDRNGNEGTYPERVMSGSKESTAGKNKETAVPEKKPYLAPIQTTYV